MGCQRVTAGPWAIPTDSARAPPLKRLCLVPWQRAVERDRLRTVIDRALSSNQIGIRVGPCWVCVVGSIHRRDYPG